MCTVEAGDEVSIGIEVLGPVGGWGRDEPVSLRMTVAAFGIIGTAELGQLRRSQGSRDEHRFLVDCMTDLFGEIHDGFINARDELDKVAV